MDFIFRFLKTFPLRLRDAIARRVHDRRIQTRLQVGSALALGVGLVLSATLLSGVLDPFQSRFSDFFYQPAPPSSRVVVVVADDATLSEFGPLPIPADVFVTALGNIAAAHPELIGSEPIYDLSPDIDALPLNLLPIPGVVQPDADGVVRRASLLVDNSNYLGDRDSLGRVYVNFVDPARRLVVSFADVFHGRVPPSVLYHKQVLIGVTSAAASETIRTPLTYDSRRAFPIEIHADLQATIIEARFLSLQDRLTQVTMILLMALLAGATLPHVRLISGTGLTILYLLAYVGYGFAKFREGIIVQPLYPAFALILTAAAVMAYRHFAEDRPTELVRQLFQRHVPPDTLDPLLAALDRGALQLGGARREISVLCVDLSAFTALADQMRPEAVLTLLGRYTGTVVSIIFQQNGTLVSQSGDALVAAWNLPLEQRDHARRAALAAREVKRRLALLAAEQPHELDLGVGMGIATGKVAAGRVGETNRGDYCVVGEPIEIAGRLALNSDHAILMNAAALNAIGDAVQTREAKPMRVRGKTDLVPTWQICEPAENAPVPYPTASSA